MVIELNICPLCARSELCSAREACVPGPPGKLLPQGVHTQANLPVAWLADYVTRWPVDMWLPYINWLSKSIRKVLDPLAIQVACLPFRTLRLELVHPKDPVPANHRKRLGYSIPCAACPCTYLGQTGRSSDHLIQEHRWALKNEDLGSSALA